MIISKDRLPNLKKNGFIVIEGVNGAGKTTVKSHIVSVLKNKNLPFIETFEPGDTALGKELRRLLLDDDRNIKSKLAELFLFAADRAEHVNCLIKPAIENKQIVVCDRYYYSTTAFQGHGRQNDLNLIDTINKIAVCDTYPDLVILLDIDAQSGLSRNKQNQIGGNSFSVDALEKESLDFHNKIRQGFLEIAENSAEPFIVIDASRDKEVVLQEVQEVMLAYL
mgnify:CR=1 FL=1